jgi:hypothetical protein
MTAAVRQHRARKRRRAGLTVFHIEADENATAAALIAAGR